MKIRQELVIKKKENDLVAVDKKQVDVCSVSPRNQQQQQFVDRLDKGLPLIGRGSLFDGIPFFAKKK